MKKLTSLTILTVTVVITGCSNPMGYVTPSSPSKPQARNISVPHYETPTTDKESKFQRTMVSVAQSTKQNPNYRKLSLNTSEEKAWFKNLMYRLWDRQITRAQFIAEGTSRYPRHKYEFTYIANAFQNY